MKKLKPSAFEKMKNIADGAKKLLTPTKPHKYQIPGSDNYIEIKDNNDNNVFLKDIKNYSLKRKIKLKI